MIAPDHHRHAGIRGFLERASANVTSVERLAVIDLAAKAPGAELFAEVAAGLGRPAGQRAIPCRWLYDEAGSQLYQAITETVEYYPTRTEAAILGRYGGDLAHRLGPAARTLIELGSGSSEKTRLLLSAWRAADRPMLYVPVDVSHEMLAASAAALTDEYPALRVLALSASYQQALETLAPCERSVVAFLGGTIGNFAPDEQDAFVKLLAARLPRGAYFLLGFDRTPHAGKPVGRIVAAYDDAAGVTARFSLNLLARLNRELGADFDLTQFAHRAGWHAEREQIEIHLESLAAQTVHLPGLGDLHFEAGEGIHTEISRRHDPARLAAWMRERGFQAEITYSDDDELFALMLFRRE